MAQKTGFFGNPTNYSFPLAGRRLLYAPLNTIIPSVVVPIYDTSMPAGWTDLGPPVGAQVDVSIDFTTQDIVTGVLQSVRRTYIEKQTGKISAKVFAWEPQKIADATGQTPIVSGSTTSLNRSFKDVFLGGQLGDKLALLTYEDFDITLAEDIAAGRYEQVWIYTPKAQKTGGINLSELETKTPVITLDYELLPYTNTAAGGRDILLQVRFIGTT